MERSDSRIGWDFDTSRPLGSFVEVVRGVIGEPARFFAEFGEPSAERYKPPLIFAVICGVISAPLSLLPTPLNPLMPEGGNPTSAFLSLVRDNPGAAIALAVVLILLLPLFVVLGVYLGSAIQHLFVFVFVRERRGFWGTFPVVAYGSSAISLLSWIPLLGYLASLYGVYVTVVGLRELHGTTTVRASLAVLVPFLIGLAPLIFTLVSTPAGA